MSLDELVVSLLEEHADAEVARGMKKYMRDKFEFYGVSSPLRRSICKVLLDDSKKLDHEMLIFQIDKLWN